MTEQIPGYWLLTAEHRRGDELYRHSLHIADRARPMLRPSAEARARLHLAQTMVPEYADAQSDLATAILQLRLSCVNDDALITGIVQGIERGAAARGALQMAADTATIRWTEPPPTR